MKIENKNLAFFNFTIKPEKVEGGDSSFAEYLKVALSELETQEFLQKTQEEKTQMAFNKIEQTLEILESMVNTSLSSSKAETIGDFLLSQAMEIDKIVSSLPESYTKKFIKDWAFLLGVEAQKIKKGFYS
ncbi:MULTISPECIES: hypothetical protein [Thermodesulfobacterium]|jgi:phage terminase Nu1 subunit (DNA packaging protein)|uniref:Uncharacterized protein n=1 Tax=Thermodesulfobacterium commune DSM 2178 TaxID=289377 RepID=A0A075WRJ2_9BACT|nr:MULTISPECIES: hypothetical protein [Thermodesulfobacterium]AIH03585.1 hypothetical protein HL41_01375 [Thermodesulfobacterium commune DSM 2178]MDK2862089.1 hypothetical protein [Thermodesulfobacterium sp.]MDN5378943.1 hypothetical protein [Thermodesulfobacterium sp.]